MYKYNEIANTLKERIVNGEYPENSLMPKMETFTHEFKTSRVTVRKAIQRLIDEGIIYTRQGSGTYVYGHLRHDETIQSSLASSLGTTYQRTIPVSSKILRFDVRFPSENERTLLELTENSPVYDIKRIRLAEDRPLSIESSIMPYSLIPGISRDILEHSIYHYIRHELHLNIGSAQRVILASKAGKLDVQTFKIELGAPVLESNQLVFLGNGRPFDLSKTRYPYASGNVLANITEKAKINER